MQLGDVTPNLDGSSGEASSPADTASQDAAATTWCMNGSATAATFCTDFDIAPFDRGIALKQATNGGALVLDPNIYRSPPYSLRVSIPKANGAPYGTSALLNVVLPIAGKTLVTIEFDVNLERTPALEANETLQFFVWGVDGTDMMAMALKAKGLTFYTLSYDGDAGDALEQVFAAPPPGLDARRPHRCSSGISQWLSRYQAGRPTLGTPRHRDETEGTDHYTRHHRCRYGLLGHRARNVCQLRQHGRDDEVVRPS